MNLKILIVALILTNFITLLWGLRRFDIKFINDNYITKIKLYDQYVDKNDFGKVIDINKYDNQTFLIYGLISRKVDEIQAEYKDFGISIKAVAGCSVLKANVDKWNLHNDDVINMMINSSKNPDEEKIKKLKSYRLDIP